MDPPINEKIIGKWQAVRDLAVCVCVPPETADVQSEAQKRSADLCERAEAIRKKSGQILRLLEAHHGNQVKNFIPVMEGSGFDIFDQIRVLAMTVAMPEARAEWMFASKRIIRATWRVEAMVSMQVLSGEDPLEGDALTLLSQDSTAEGALGEQLLLGTLNAMSMVSQESHHERAAGRRAQESVIIQKFKQIREMAAGLELVEDAAELWGSAGRTRALCKEILQLLDHECVESEEVEDYANECSVTRIFRDI